MSDMNRRQFLRGTVESVGAASLVIAASPFEIAAFGHPQSVVVGAPMTGPVTPYLDLGEVLFNNKGLPVCVIENIHLTTEAIDMSMAGNEYRTFRPGTRTVRLDCVALGTVSGG